jgi:hypothetical protein
MSQMTIPFSCFTKLLKETASISFFVPVSLSEKQVVAGYLQRLSVLSPFRASNMCDKPCRIAQVYENGGERVCRMVT